jgi:CHAT domain-containing protein/tetratricopeptide (TPR) repeat protein
MLCFVKRSWVTCWVCAIVHCSAALTGTSQPSLREAYLRAGALLERGAAAEALELAGASGKHAAKAGRRDYELLFLTVEVNANSALYNTRAALASARRAADLARELRQPDSIAAVGGLLADLYARLGQNDAALSSVAEATGLLSQLSPRVRARLLALTGKLRFVSGDRTGALRDYGLALNEADRAGDDAALADTWDNLGLRLLESSDRPGVDAALTEAFRLRRMHGDNGLDSTLRSLGMLKLAEGDPRTAEALLDRAAKLIEAGRSRVPPWSVYYHRALSKRALGNLDGALSDFARTFELVRGLRADLVPTDEVQSYVDTKVRRFYRDYVTAGMELYARHPSPELAAEMFVVSEENRASGLRQTRGWVERLPARYWEIIAEVRSLAIANLAGSSAQHRARLRLLEGELTRIESGAGFTTATSPEKKEPARALSSLQASLQPEESLLSFYLGDAESYVWAITSIGIEVHTLPGRQQVSAAVREFRDNLVARNDAAQSGGKLFNQLFGAVGRAVHNRRDWILVLDDALFEVPFSALHDGDRYTIERHTLRALPSAFMLLDTAAREQRSGLLAIGDPVYNGADSRRSHPGRGGMELARIPASGVEARRCATAWKSGAAVVLTGPEVTRSRLEQELLRRPAALHMAVHVLSSDDGARALIGLGMDPAGQPDFLDAFEISRKRYGVPMVVMSGCSSGRGRVVSGAGLTGLTRAWLLSGSQAVTASHWPTADDTGELFAAFYRAIGRFPEPFTARSCARALRLAQLEMLNSGSWRSQPHYWAAFFVTGRD